MTNAQLQVPLISAIPGCQKLCLNLNFSIHAHVSSCRKRSTQHYGNRLSPKSQTWVGMVDEMKELMLVKISLFAFYHSSLYKVLQAFLFLVSSFVNNKETRTQINYVYSQFFNLHNSSFNTNDFRKNVLNYFVTNKVGTCD